MFLEWDTFLTERTVRVDARQVADGPAICPHRGQIEPDSDGAAPTSTTIAEGRAATRSDSLGDGPAMPSAQGLTNEQSSRVYYRVVEFPC